LKKLEKYFLATESGHEPFVLDIRRKISK